MRVFGVDSDVQHGRTKSVRNNGKSIVWWGGSFLGCVTYYFTAIAGYNPQWDDVIDFSISVPELALLHFVAMESNNTSLGQYALPFQCLAQGKKRKQTEK